MTTAREKRYEHLRDAANVKTSLSPPVVHFLAGMAYATGRTIEQVAWDIAGNKLQCDSFSQIVTGHVARVREWTEGANHG